MGYRIRGYHHQLREALRLDMGGSDDPDLSSYLRMCNLSMALPSDSIDGPPLGGYTVSIERDPVSSRVFKETRTMRNVG